MRNISRNEFSRLFRISSRSHHGMLFLAEIGRHERDASAGTRSVRSVAQRLRISEKYLEQLVGALRGAGIVRGTRGRSGGYSLAKPAAAVTMGDVVRALDGPIVLAACQDAESGMRCPHAAQCATKHVLGRLRQAIERELDGMTVADLSNIEHGT